MIYILFQYCSLKLQHVRYIFATSNNETLLKSVQTKTWNLGTAALNHLNENKDAQLNKENEKAIKIYLEVYIQVIPALLVYTHLQYYITNAKIVYTLYWRDMVSNGMKGSTPTPHWWRFLKFNLNTCATKCYTNKSFTF